MLVNTIVSGGVSVACMHTSPEEQYVADGCMRLAEDIGTSSTFRILAIGDSSWYTFLQRQINPVCIIYYAIEFSIIIRAVRLPSWSNTLILQCVSVVNAELPLPQIVDQCACIIRWYCIFIVDAAKESRGIMWLYIWCQSTLVSLPMNDYFSPLPVCLSRSPYW